MSYQNCPNYEQPLTKSGQTQSVWYRFFQGLYTGVAPTSEDAVKIGASPFSFVFPSRGFVIIQGGTVSAVQFTRAVTTLTGLTAGIFPGSLGDTLTVTYSGLPNMLFVPQ